MSGAKSPIGGAGHTPPSEADIVSFAIEPARRAQFIARLAAPRTRRKLLDCLNHVAPLDPASTTWFKTFADAVREVNVAADTPVIVISSVEGFDGAVLPFGDAVAECEEGGWGTIIGISRDLAIYCDEQGDTPNAAVIRRRDAV